MQLIQFILGLTALIIIHELGHFLAARLLKVPVDEFGIGFPPRLLGTARDNNGKRRWFNHRTPEDIDPDSLILSLNWIPLGGFVRPRGENDPDVAGGLASANPWVRLGVFFAGPAANIIVGLIMAIAIIYSNGEPVTNKVIIQSVESGSPAESAGLLANDLFITINGETPESIDGLRALIEKNKGQSTTVVMLRGEETVTVVLVPRQDPPPGQGALGVILANPTRPISLIAATGGGLYAVYNFTNTLLHLPLRILNGQAAPEESRLVGYKGMYDIYTRLPSPWEFFAVISLSLGIFNLLPIPALDGGRILLTLPEIIIRKRIPADYENAIHFVGFAMLILLLIYVNVQDFINPAVLP